MTFRLAHYSDTHVTVSPLSSGWRHLIGKRLSGAMSYTVGRRKWHFSKSDLRTQRLLEDIDRLGVDHALCTGDVTQMSFDAEFARCAQIYGPRLGAPQRHTVLPGNHDRYTYTAHAERRFELHLGPLAAPQDRYPFVKPLSDRVVLVGIDVARPTGMTDSSGLCGALQRAELEAILTDDSLKNRYVVLALHYGLLRRTGRRDRPTHRIRDDVELLELLDRDDVHLDLVLHGHMHRPFTVKTKRRTIVCSGSSTDLGGRCGYNVYAIDPDARSFTVERRAWDAGAGAYVAGR